MKKKVLLLLPLFLGACSGSEESPVITIDRLLVSGDEENYANRMDELPALKVGDVLDTYLSLDGNGAELKTFKLQKDDEVKTELLYKKNEVSTEGNLTDEQKGQLRFKDGVTKTTVLIHATVDHIDQNGNVKLAFYLSSKAECEGAQEEIYLKTKVSE